MKFFNCLFGLAVSFLPMTAQAQWDECCPQDYSCCQPATCCPECDYAVNPPLLAPTECGTFYVEGTYLLWRPHCDGLTPGWLTTVYPNSGTEDDRVNSTKLDERKFKYTWDSGFRVAVGYGFPCDQWSVRANYTYFCSTANDHFVKESGLLDEDIFFDFIPYAFQDTFVVGNSNYTITENAHWKVELHQADFELTREYYVGCDLMLRPYVGGRFVWLDQKMHLDVAQSFTDEGDPSLSTGSSSLLSRNECRYYGGGVKAGLESHYELACGFGLYGDAQIAVVYGEFSVINENDFFTNNEAGQGQDGTTLTNAKDNCCFCSLKPIFDYSFGLYYRKEFNCEKSLFEIRAGWEHHIYLSQNQFFGQTTTEVSGGIINRPAPGSIGSGKNELRGGDLSFAGLAVTASILF